MNRSDPILQKRIDSVFSQAYRENKKERFNLADFKNWKSLTGPKLAKAVENLNEILKESGEVFVLRKSKKSNQRARQLHGFVRVEILKPGGHYRDAKLKILVSDDQRIQSPESKVYPERIREMEFTTKYFDKVKIMSFADHKIKSQEIYYVEDDNYTPPDEQLYAPVGSVQDSIDPKSQSSQSQSEFDSLYEDLPYFDKPE